MKQVNALLDMIYDASTDAHNWPSALTAINTYFNSSGSFIIRSKDISFSNNTEWVSSENISDIINKYINSGWYRRDYFNSELQNRGKFKTFSDFGLILSSADSSHPNHKDFFAMHNIAQSVGSMMFLPDAGIVIFRMLYEEGGGGLTRALRRNLEHLLPHLDRSVRISAQMPLSHARTTTMAIQGMGSPVALVGRDGCILSASEDMERILLVLTATRTIGRLTLANQAVQKIFDSVISAAISGPMPIGRSVPLRVSGLPPLVLHSVPIASDIRTLFPLPAAVLTLTPIGTVSAPPPSLLQALFGLTPAESRLAQGLAEGRPLDALSEQWGVSRETLRTQLRSIFAKTGTNRQAELASILTSISLSIPSNTKFPNIN